MSAPSAGNLALQALGYTERQARFLELVAAHAGGHFLRRHYARFIGSRDVGGNRVHGFLERASKRHHVRAYVHGTARERRYHVGGQAVYEALGRPDSTARQHGSLAAVGVRFTALDFILDNQAGSHLDDEARLAFFDAQGVPREALPAFSYRIPSDPATVRLRYFFDGFPLWLEDGVPSFAYIPGGPTSFGSWATHLRRYRPLLCAYKGRARFAYVGSSEPEIERAARVFRQVLGAHDDLHAEVFRYFQLRALREEGRFSQLTAQDHVLRAQLARRYAGEHYDRLYRDWLDAGKTLLKSTALDSPEAVLERVEFRAYFPASGWTEPSKTLRPHHRPHVTTSNQPTPNDLRTSLEVDPMTVATPLRAPGGAPESLRSLGPDALRSTDQTTNQQPIHKGA